MKTSRLQSLGLLFFAMSLCLIALPAFASSGGGHVGEIHINWWAFDKHAPAVGWLIVDFSIVIGILVFFGRKPIAEMLQGRSLSVRKALEEAASAKAEAEARAAELEKRLKDLDKEITGLRDEIKTSGERERAQLEADGKKSAERIARDTELQIQSEVTRARELLKADAVALAMELADKSLRQQLTSDDYIRLNKQFVESFVSTTDSEAVSQ
jgi:F-type H+-transporting ATPase subunit b